MIVPAAAAPRAVASSPSGCAARWNAVGATSTGSAISVPSAVVAVDVSATSTSIRGRSTQRRNAARFSRERPLVVRAAGEVAERAGLELLLRRALVVPDVQQLGHVPEANAVRRPPYGGRAMQQGRWTIRPCPHGEASALAAALEIGWVTASVLVRRGLGDPDAARAFLAAEPPRHDAGLLGDTAAACDRIRAAIAAGERICVHGDYDVDGICATALAVTCLRELGANVEWHLPSRFDEGYGVAGETLARLAEDGVSLVLTVDCGITAVDEVAEARRLGLDVIVTDHHRPAETLPDCPIVATRPSKYPFPELCGTGVAYKLLAALGARRRQASRPGRAGHDRRRRPVARREPCARGGRAARARAHAEAGAPGADARGACRSGRRRHRRGRLPARTADQRGRAARPPGRGPRAAAHGRPRRGRPARLEARGAQPRTPGGRGAGSCARRSRRSASGRRPNSGSAPTCSPTKVGTKE